MFKNYNEPHLAKHISSAAIETVKHMLKEYQKLNFNIFKERFKKDLKERLSNDEMTKDWVRALDYDEVAKLVYRRIAEYYIANKTFKGLSEYLQLINFIIDGELTFRTIRANEDAKEKLF
jgi:siroheme synthase (precorrin-2 oxidase/ferrochelatase)